jgi:hypothetical protein
MAIPEHLASTHRMLVAAFPDGVAGEDYLATIALLHGYMSARCLAETMVLAFGSFGVTYHTVYNDIGRVASPDVFLPDVLTRVRARLTAAGYEDWLHKSDAV